MKEKKFHLKSAANLSNKPGPLILSKVTIASGHLDW